MKYLIITLLISSGALLIIGALVTSFSFDFQGAAGWALKGENVFDYSLISLGYNLPDDVRDPSSFGVHFI